MGNVYLFLAQGFEEVEALTQVDLLRRAGINVKTVSVTGKPEVESSHRVTVKADCLFEDTDFSDARMLILPGGMPGTKNLGNHRGLVELLKKYHGEGGKIAAICAAPSVLGSIGILEGKRATCYPGFEELLIDASLSSDKVVVDGNITTGKGMGAGIAFGLALVAQLDSQQKADTIAEAIIYGHKH